MHERAHHDGNVAGRAQNQADRVDADDHREVLMHDVHRRAGQAAQAGDFGQRLRDFKALLKEVFQPVGRRTDATGQIVDRMSLHPVLCVFLRQHNIALF